MEDGEEEGSKVVREGQEISNKTIGAEHFDQNPPLVPANGTVNLDHEYGMVTEKSQGDGEDNGVKQVSVGEENSPCLGMPQAGDGVSASSDESETTG